MRADLTSHFVHALILCAAPVGSELLLSVLGLFWRPNAKIVSGLQHLAAGVITAAVAAELVPLLLDRFKRESYYYVAVLVGFLIAVVGFSLLSHFLPEQCDEDDCDKKKQRKDESCSKGDGCSTKEKHASTQGCCEGESCKKEPAEATPLISGASAINSGGHSDALSLSAHVLRLPWLMIIPLAVDTFLDGLLLALADVVEPHAGVIVAVAFAVETAVLGAMTSATLRHKHYPSMLILIVSFVLCVLFILGALLGAASISFTSGPVFIGFLTFGVASLLYLVADHLLMEAREKQKAAVWLTRVQFYIGFLLVLLIHLATE